MGRRTRGRARRRAALAADLAVTVLGVAGLLGFLVAARMDESQSFALGVLAFVWFFSFAALKLGLPWFLARRAARASAGRSGSWAGRQ